MQEPNRRGFIAGVASLSLTALAWPEEALAAPVRTISLYNRNTTERLQVDYWQQGRYIGESLHQINRIMRDHHNDQQHVMAPHLLDMIWAMRMRLATSSPFHIICGYRSPATNALMRAHTSGVAKDSMHLYGKAVDLSVPGRDLIRVRNAALSLRMGGVGYYGSSGFVHIDVGAVRHWG